MTYQKEFEFNVRKARQSSALLIGSSLSLICLLSILDNTITDWYSEFNPLFFLVLSVYVFFILNLSKRIYNSYFIKTSIIFEKNELLIPTYYFGLEKVSLKDIYSVEDVSLKKEGGLLVLGIQNKNGLFLDKYRFSRIEDFFEFKEIIKGIIVSNSNDESRRVVERVAELKSTQIAYFTYIVTLLCVVIYFLGTSGRLEYPEDSIFVLLGAGSRSFLKGQEFYRIFSSSFIHANIFHLGINIMAIGMIGELLEKLISPVRFLNVLLCSALGALLSFSLLSSYEYGAGLSGGVFGICGAYVALRVRYEKFLPGSLSMVPLNRLLLIIVLELIVEYFFLDNIDQYSHLGGFIAGFLYLYFIPLGEKLEKVNQPFLIEKGVCVCLALSYSLGISYFLLLYYGFL